MFEAIGGRKLVFGLLMMLAGIGLALQGKLTAETTAFLLGIYGMFAGANAFTTVKTASSPQPQASEPEVTSPPQPAVDPVVEQALMALMQRQQAADDGIKAMREQLLGVQKALEAALAARASQVEANRQVLQNLGRQTP